MSLSQIQAAQVMIIPRLILVNESSVLCLSLTLSTADDCQVMGEGGEPGKEKWKNLGILAVVDFCDFQTTSGGE